MGRVLMPSSLNLAVREAVPASLVLEGASPIALAKALKNEQELQASRQEALVESRRRRPAASLLMCIPRLLTSSG